MNNLSYDIEESIKIVLEGLSFDVVISDVDPEKMTRAMKSKEDSFLEAKALMNDWMNSANRPSDEKAMMYAKQLVLAGDGSIIKLRKSLTAKIDYSILPAEKHGMAIKAKTIILKAIRNINASLVELRIQISENSLRFKEDNYKVGYAERFANQEFYPKVNYFKQWHNKEEDAVMICPFGTKGDIIEIEGLKIQLPKVPTKKHILFSKEPISNQHWRREGLPKGLTPDSSDSFASYIMEQFRKRREGVWFMNNGKATYIPGTFWFALEHCKMLDNGGYMLFKEAQLRMAYHQEACFRDPRSLGELFVKSRRTGYSFMILFRLLEEATCTKNGRYGMTSKSNDDVEESFGKFSYAFLELPFFFQPVVRGKVESGKKLFFGKPADTSREAKLKKETSTSDYLNTEIDTRPTKNDSYDSTKLNGYLGEEPAKWKPPVNYIEHFGTIKPTMMPGGRVIGKCWLGSTIGALNKGGANYKVLDNMSDVTQRNELTGKTSSGLYSYFLPAQENQEICTDIYGKCWQEKPPAGTLDNFGEEIKFGSIEFLKSLEKEAMSKGDNVLNAHYRAEPMTREQAYRDKSDDCMFNINKLYEQLDYNNSKDAETLYTVGNFAWKDGIRDSEVVFTPNKNGRFKLAWLPSMVDGTKHIMNNVTSRGNKFYPNNDFGYLSSDPFSVRSASGGRGSSGAIHGFCSTSIGNLEKGDCFLQYLCRAKTEDIFFEDVVMAMHFFGIKILAELNRVDLLRYIRNRGYRPFSEERLDKHRNKLTPHEEEYGGQQMSGESILDNHLSAINSYIDYYVGVAGKNNPFRPEGEMGKFPFNETLEDWKIFDPSDRTKHDASISSGLGIMAINKEKYKPKKAASIDLNINDLFPTIRI